MILAFDVAFAGRRAQGALDGGVVDFRVRPRDQDRLAPRVVDVHPAHAGEGVEGLPRAAVAAGGAVRAVEMDPHLAGVGLHLDLGRGVEDASSPAHGVGRPGGQGEHAGGGPEKDLVGPGAAFPMDGDEAVGQGGGPQGQHVRAGRLEDRPRPEEAEPEGGEGEGKGAAEGQHRRGQERQGGGQLLFHLRVHCNARDSGFAFAAGMVFSPSPRRFRRRSVAMRKALLVLVLASTASAQEWTRFRGPNGTGVSEAKGLPTTWSESDILWKADLPGQGHSQPVIWEEKLFVTTAKADGTERALHAIDKAAGKTLWTKAYPMSTHGKHKLNSFASSSPAV